ncbi:hypothetical protein POM88_002359 [Heracleum sosnowskyi]|uniref:F-box associated domain-containing protein n=1 Tax=Heracleum sosnowskyi TaxID=360622 RepID=A0AAD8NAG3_9APIA|nr:hypothetical protein POM88_002359 [Heracleum sosnowskyi]
MYDMSCRALWNPAINELKRLPKIVRKPDFPVEFTYAANEVYGFGCDRISGDYKVVVMKGYWSVNRDSDLKHPVSVLVYSLRTNLWSYCGDLDKAYDLKTNKCYVYIDVPDYAKPSSSCLAVYDDSLVFLSICETGNIFDIWTWSEEGRWTKKFTVGPFPCLSSPVGHWKGNWLVLQSDEGKLLLYDPGAQEIEDLAFVACEGVYAYMESLVSIKDKNEAGQQPEESGKTWLHLLSSLI